MQILECLTSITSSHIDIDGEHSSNVMIASESLSCIIADIIVVLIQLYLIRSMLFYWLVLLKAILTLRILNELINHDPLLLL